MFAVREVLFSLSKARNRNRRFTPRWSEPGQWFKRLVNSQWRCWNLPLRLPLVTTSSISASPGHFQMPCRCRRMQISTSLTVSPLADQLWKRDKKRHMQADPLSCRSPHLKALYRLTREPETWQDRVTGEGDGCDGFSSHGFIVD